jgi:hypothetical protein
LPSRRACRSGSRGACRRDARRSCAPLHEALSLATLAALGLPAIALLGDGWLHPGFGGVVHTLGAGTDAGQPWFLALAAVVVLPPLALLGMRLFGRSVGSAMTRSPVKA